jgi:hypothetical protein
MSKKQNQLDAATDAEAKNDSYLLPLADPINGLSKKMTVAQAKEAFGVKKKTYVATGAEGSTLTIPELSGKEVLMIGREMGLIYEVGASPLSNQFTWDDTDIVLGAPVSGAGEQFIILYRTY